MNLPKELYVRIEIDGQEVYYVAGRTIEEALPPERESVKIGRYVLAESFWAVPKAEIQGCINHERTAKKLCASKS